VVTKWLLEVLDVPPATFYTTPLSQPLLDQSDQSVRFMDLLVLDTAIPYKRRSTLKKHITDFGTFPHFILTCIKICFSLLLQYVCRFDVSQMSILKFEINSKV
jgi:hypothetical protein